MTSYDGGYYPPPSGQPWGGPQGPPPKGKSPWPWIIGIGSGVLVLVLVAAVGLVVINAGGEGDERALERTEVTYEVTGLAGSVELSYWGTEGQELPITVSLPWRETVTLEGEDAFFHVSAQTVDASDQELACQVVTAGRTLVADRTVTGFVGCDGRLNEF